MRYAIAIGFCAALGFGASAQATELSLKSFLEYCDTGDPGTCMDLLETDYNTQAAMGGICAPADLPPNAAATAVLDWMRKLAATNSAAAAASAGDAEQRAQNALWPCH